MGKKGARRGDWDRNPMYGVHASLFLAFHLVQACTSVIPSFPRGSRVLVVGGTVLGVAELSVPTLIVERTDRSRDSPE